MGAGLVRRIRGRLAFVAVAAIWSCVALVAPATAAGATLESLVERYPMLVSEQAVRDALDSVGENAPAVEAGGMLPGTEPGDLVVSDQPLVDDTGAVLDDVDQLRLVPSVDGLALVPEDWGGFVSLPYRSNGTARVGPDFQRSVGITLDQRSGAEWKQIGTLVHYPGVRPGVDQIFDLGSSTINVKEWLWVEDAKALARVRYQINAGPEREVWQQSATRLAVFDPATTEVVLTIDAPVAYDEDGKGLAVTIELAEDRRSFSLAVDAAGGSDGPWLVDPNYSPNPGSAGTYFLSVCTGHEGLHDPYNQWDGCLSDDATIPVSGQPHALFSTRSSNAAKFSWDWNNTNGVGMRAISGQAFSPGAFAAWRMNPTAHVFVRQWNIRGLFRDQSGRWSCRVRYHQGGSTFTSFNKNSETPNSDPDFVFEDFRTGTHADWVELELYTTSASNFTLGAGQNYCRARYQWTSLLYDDASPWALSPAAAIRAPWSLNGEDTTLFTPDRWYASALFDASNERLQLRAQLNDLGSGIWQFWPVVDGQQAISRHICRGLDPRDPLNDTSANGMNADPRDEDVRPCDLTVDQDQIIDPPTQQGVHSVAWGVRDFSRRQSQGPVSYFGIDSAAPTCESDGQWLSTLGGPHTFNITSMGDVVVGGKPGSGLARVEVWASPAQPTQPDQPWGGGAPVATMSVGASQSSATISIPGSSVGTTYAVWVIDRVGHATACLDTVGPQVACAGFSETSVFTFAVAGCLLWYNPMLPPANVSFDVLATATDNSSVASVSFTDFTPPTAGWADPSPAVDALAEPGSVYRTTYTYAPNLTADPPAGVATAADGAGNTSTASYFIDEDRTAPAGATIVVPNGFTSATATAVTFTTGADTQSGIQDWWIERSDAPLANGACGAFGAFAQFGGVSPNSPVADTTLVHGRCYRYQLVVRDNVQNEAVVTGAGTVIVDTAAPTAACAGFAETSVFTHAVAGCVLWYNPILPPGNVNFDALATATDADSGVASVAFTDFTPLTGWATPTPNPDTASEPVDLYRTTYTYTPGPTLGDPPLGTATVTDVAGNTAAATYTIDPDFTPPAGGTISHFDGFTNNLTVAVAYTLGADGQSGIQDWWIERRAAVLTNGVCGAFAAWAQVDSGTGAGGGTFNDTTVTAGNCYEYRLFVRDNVQNISAAIISGDTTRIETTPPTAACAGFAETSVFTHAVAGCVLWYNPILPPGNVNFDALATATDADSGVASVAFTDFTPLTGWATPTPNPDTASEPVDLYRTTYTYTPGPTLGDPPLGTATVTDVAGNTAAATYTIDPDFTPPAGATIAYPDGFTNNLSVPVSFTTGTDTQSGIQDWWVERSQAPLAGGTCGAYGAFTAVGTNSPGSPLLDTTLSSATCYRYRLIVRDNVQNQATFASAAEVRVDTAPPTITCPPLFIETAAPAGLYTHWAGGCTQPLWYNPAPGNLANVSFDVQVNAADAASGMQQVDFTPVAAAGWTNTPNSPGDTTAPFSSTYTYTPGPADPGTNTATAIDAAGNTSSISYEIDADFTAPAGGTITYPNVSNGGSAPVSFTTGTDTQSGIQDWRVERRSAPFVNRTCGTFGTWAQVGPLSPASSLVDTTLAAGTCYQYRLVVTDNVQNIGIVPPSGTIIDPPADPCVNDNGQLNHAEPWDPTFTADQDATGFSSLRPTLSVLQRNLHLQCNGALPYNWNGTYELRHAPSPFHIEAAGLVQDTALGETQFSWTDAGGRFHTYTLARATVTDAGGARDAMLEVEIEANDPGVFAPQGGRITIRVYDGLTVDPGNEIYSASGPIQVRIFN